MEFFTDSAKAYRRGGWRRRQAIIIILALVAAVAFGVWYRRTHADQ